MTILIYLTNQLTTEQSFELLSLNIQDCCLLCQILIYETCLKKKPKTTQSLWATSCIIFNLLKVVSIW
jgi:hypothetical protein